MIRSSICLALLALEFFIPTGSPIAAAEPKASASATGISKLERRPDLLRVRIELTAKGKTVRDAVAKLSDRRDAARTKLVALGAAKDQIKIADPVAVATDNDQRAQMQMMVRARMSGRGGKKAKHEVKPPVTVGATLVAELPLAADASPDEMLTLVEDLREKIRASDLAGAKDADKLSPEEEELAAEMEDQGMSFDNYNNGQPKPGEPMFIFVSRISEAEHAKLVSEAYQKAHAKAYILATAANAHVGDLISLSCEENGLGGSMVNSWRPYQLNPGNDELISSELSGQSLSTSNIHEAMGASPGKVAYFVTVLASFELK